MSLGKKIAIYRAKLRLTQQQFAELLGIKWGGTVSDWETGKSKPRKKIRAAILALINDSSVDKDTSPVLLDTGIDLTPDPKPKLMLISKERFVGEADGYLIFKE